MYQNTIKIVLDKLVALMSILILTPFFVFLVFLLYFFQQQKVFFVQIRVGKDKMPFKIYKFQTMSEERDSEGNLLPDDARITTLGKFFRKTSLDELPQLWNVIKGEMSMVGPRPERQFYIDQIVQQAPHYNKLLKVRPGITSWGQVKYGYAENVDEMVQRSRFDLIYIENMSIALDIKILFYTVLTVLKGRGK